MKRLGGAGSEGPISWNEAMLGRKSGMVCVPRETRVVSLFRDPESVDLNSTHVFSSDILYEQVYVIQIWP